jgi:hypothetical protein
MKKAHCRFFFLAACTPEQPESASTSPPTESTVVPEGHSTWRNFAQLMPERA